MIRDNILYLSRRVSSFNYSTLSPTDKIKLYHGTTSKHALELCLNGIDANSKRKRDYSSLTHRGFFLTPLLNVAKRFGKVILEIEIEAEYLYGTKDIDVEEGSEIEEDLILKNLYRNSFRPSLSHSLSNSGEPQAVLVGTHSPEIIKNVYIDSNRITRKDFIKDSKSEKLARAEETINFNKAVKLIADHRGEKIESIKKILSTASEKELRDLLEVFFSPSQINEIILTMGI